jgi:uncharacterized membrane protein
LGRILRIFLTGVLALLPVAVTFFVVAWVGSFIASLAGWGSFIGSLITGLGNSLGLTIEPTSGAAYLLGLAIIVASFSYSAFSSNRVCNRSSSTASIG